MFLVDTNVLAEMRRHGRGDAHPAVAAWLDGQDISRMYLSAITLFETERGVLRKERSDPAQGAVLRGWFTLSVLGIFGSRILGIDAAVAREVAKLHVPNPAPLTDSLIASTAIVHGLTVATRNTADFRFPGVAVLNPWDHPLPPAAAGR